jgi:ribosomal protein L7/L12
MIRGPIDNQGDAMDVSMLFVFVLLTFLIGVSAKVSLADLQTRIAALHRIEGKVDLLLKHAGLAFDPYANVPAEVPDAVEQGRKIKAIKLYRQFSGLGLREAKAFVEEVQRRAGK